MKITGREKCIPKILAYLKDHPSTTENLSKAIGFHISYTRLFTVFLARRGDIELKGWDGKSKILGIANGKYKRHVHVMKGGWVGADLTAKDLAVLDNPQPWELMKLFYGEKHAA